MHFTFHIFDGGGRRSIASISSISSLFPTTRRQPSRELMHELPHVAHVTAPDRVRRARCRGALGQAAEAGLQTVSALQPARVRAGVPPLAAPPPTASPPPPHAAHLLPAAQPPPLLPAGPDPPPPLVARVPPPHVARPPAAQLPAAQPPRPPAAADAQPRDAPPCTTTSPERSRIASGSTSLVGPPRR